MCNFSGEQILDSYHNINHFKSSLPLGEWNLQSDAQ